jgi:prepilin-type N-terminal cleavage/methylation domain-containing protein
MKKNNGFTLLEVLISMLLLVVIGLGGAYLLGRANYIQRDMNIHLLTVSQMRYTLQNGNCTALSTISINNSSVLTPCTTSSSVTYTVTGTGLSTGGTSTVTVTSPSIQVSSTDTTSTSLIPIPIKISP